MDRQHAFAPMEAFLRAPTIKRATPDVPQRFVPAPQSRFWNGLLGAAWVFHLVQIFTYVASTEPAEDAPALLYGFAVGLDLMIFFAALGAIALAAMNSARTAPVSFAIAAGTMVFGALCGLAGHPASLWLSDLAFGVVVALASVAIFARRA